MRKKKTGVISTIFLILILLVGLSVMLYPTISDWWNSKVQTRAIASYSQAVEELDDGEAELLLQQAKAPTCRRWSAPSKAACARC